MTCDHDETFTFTYLNPLLVKSVFTLSWRSKLALTSNYLSMSRFRYFDHDETLAIEDPKKMIGSEADGSNGKLIKNFTTILTTSETPRCQSVGDD